MAYKARDHYRNDPGNFEVRRHEGTGSLRKSDVVLEAKHFWRDYQWRSRGCEVKAISGSDGPA